jgi:hypothetical protein
MKTKRQSSQYDKIVRENLEALVPALLEKVLGIHAVRSEDLPDTLQHTKERKPDVLRRVTDERGDTFVLHVEFQVVDEPDMIFRMADYAVMLARRYQTTPLRQYVVFLGNQSPKMRDSLEAGLNLFRYSLVWLQQVGYETFLKAANPGEVLLSILANFGNHPPHQAVEAIVHRVEETAAGPLAFQQRLSQLRILAQIRNLQPLIDEVMEHLLKHFKEENDILYIRGRRHEAEVQKRQMVENLLTQTNLDVKTIARIAEVTQKFVRDVKNSLPN